MPKHYMKTVAIVAELARRSGFEINLWVDDPKNVANSAFFSRQGEMSDHRIPHLRVRTVAELEDAMQQDPFYTKGDQSNLKDFQAFLAREMVGLKNLGAAADLLRYEILRQEGGYYFDIDTDFELQQDSLLEQDMPLHGVLLNGDYRESDYSGGSDLIAVTKHHPLMERVIRVALERYRVFDEQEKLAKFLGGDGKSTGKKATAEQRSLMDKKRDHYERVDDSNKMERLIGLRSNRRKLKILASGPGLLFECVDKEFQGVRPDEILMPKQKGARCVAGISVISNSDQTWLKKKKQQMGFDTADLPSRPSTQFFKSPKDKEVSHKDEAVVDIPMKKKST